MFLLITLVRDLLRVYIICIMKFYNFSSISSQWLKCFINSIILKETKWHFINHSIHEQSFIDNLSYYWLLDYYITNNLPLKLGANHRRPLLYTNLYISKNLVDLKKILTANLLCVSQTHRSYMHLVHGLRKRICQWVSCVADSVNSTYLYITFIYDFSYHVITS